MRRSCQYKSGTPDLEKKLEELRIRTHKMKVQVQLNELKKLLKEELTRVEVKKMTAPIDEYIHSKD